MKSMIVVALALVAVVVALPVEDKDAQVVSENNDQLPDGSYNFGFKTDNNINRQEEGQAKEVLDDENKPQTVVVVRGSYGYINPEGFEDTINYYADETGYHADGPSVPKAERR